MRNENIKLSFFLGQVLYGMYYIGRHVSSTEHNENTDVHGTHETQTHAPTSVFDGFESLLGAILRSLGGLGGLLRGSWVLRTILGAPDERPDWWPGHPDWWPSGRGSILSALAAILRTSRCC